MTEVYVNLGRCKSGWVGEATCEGRVFNLMIDKDQTRRDFDGVKFIGYIEGNRVIRAYSFADCRDLLKRHIADSVARSGKDAK